MMNFLRKQMKWVMAIIAVAFLLSTFLMYDRGTARRTPGRNADGTISDYEVAQINGRSLMRSELERRLRDYLSNYSTRSVESLDMGMIYQAVLDQAVLESQLAKEVDEKGSNVTEAEADRAMKDFADRYYPTREMFYQALAQSGIKVDDYKKTLARQMATERFIRDSIGEIVVSEDQAVRFYDTMKGLIYSRPEGFMLHMADFKTSGDAEFFRAKLAAGESWDLIISNDELASRDVVNITRTPVYLPLSTFTTEAFNALASVDIGKPSEVFSVGSTDFAVGLKTEHVEASVRPYDEVSGDIRTMLTQQEERIRLSNFETELRNRAQVVINDQSLFARQPVVSNDTPASVDEVIPELSDSVIVSEEAKPESEEPAVETPKTESEEVKPVEEPVVIETPEPESEEPVIVETPKIESEEVKPIEEPVVIETQKVESEEVKPGTEEAVNVETPAVESIEPVKIETPAVESAE